jgi:hypothetical protein
MGRDFIQRNEPAAVVSFEFNIPYRTFLTTTYPIGLMAPVHGAAPIICNLYINLGFPAVKVSARVASCCRIVQAPVIEDFAAAGYLDYENHDHLLVGRKANRVLGFLHESFRDGWSVETNVNEFYVPQARHYRRRDHRHPLLLNGWDADRKCFLGVTYTGEDRYGEVAVPPGELLKAMSSRASFNKKAKYYDATPPKLRRARPAKGAKFRPQVALIARQLADYIDSVRPSFSYYLAITRDKNARMPAPFSPRRPYFFGTEAFAAFADYVGNVLKTPAMLDMRVSRVICEHKRMMELRLEYLAKLGYLVRFDRSLKSYRQVSTWANAMHLHLFALSRGQLHGRGQLDRLLAKASEVRELELKVLRAAVDQLGAAITDGGSGDIAKGTQPSN